jgi:hypothetical protein
VALTIEELKKAAQVFSAQLARAGDSTAGLKADLVAMVNALDDYLTANATAINNAIPQPARGRFTAGQKALAMAICAMKRYGGGLW